MKPETHTTPWLSLEHVARLRDELRLQMHLAGIDARAEWEKLERRWVELESKVEDVQKASVARAHQFENASAESAKGVKAAAELLIGELALGYERIRKILS